MIEAVTRWPAMFGIESDQQRRLGLTHEDVARGGEALRAAGAEGDDHQLGDPPHHHLHDPEVVEDAHQR